MGGGCSDDFRDRSDFVDRVNKCFCFFFFKEFFLRKICEIVNVFKDKSGFLSVILLFFRSEF